MEFVDLTAGAGGFALGLESVGFQPLTLVASDLDSRSTMLQNRSWPVVATLSDVDVAALRTRAVSLLVANVSSQGITVADTRSLHASDASYREALSFVNAVAPQAAVLVNVAGLMHRRFSGLRDEVGRQLERFGYQHAWRIVDALDYGLPQSRRRSILLAFRPEAYSQFVWPMARSGLTTVGDTLRVMMSANGWRGADQWARVASGVAPTIVGGSKSHGGADLGPTRSKAIWYSLGVDPRGVADSAPTKTASIRDMPRLTNEMIAALQGFPSDWRFHGGKTSVFRQIAGAFPPPVAAALGEELLRAMNPSR